ncbi:MAG: hypothetical protein JEZ09_16970 [Salinivirgaceae bacterium]|nr:hypothetical protein [Salinivirgaceae bacterium]
MRNTILLFLSLIIIVSCEKERNNSPKLGDIVVTVWQDGSYVANALVYTKPETSKAFTDEFGSVLLQDIKSGNYEVFAKVETIGSGKAIVTVKANELNEITIEIVEDVYYGEEPSNIELYKPIKENEAVKLIWSKYTDDNFSKYEIYRSVEGCFEEYLQLLGEINNINDTAFYDSIPPLEFQACYAIKAYDNDNNFIISNLYSIDYPSGMIFNFVPDDMFKHPTEQFLYLVDNAGLKIVKYDYVNDTILKQVTLQGDIGYCDFGDNGFGVELYVPSGDGNVYVYSGNDLSLSAMISTELSATSVVIDGLGQVIVSVLPSPWWEEPIRTYSRSNGMNIDGGGERDEERLRKIPGKNEYISISEGVSPTDMNHYKFNESGLFIEENDDTYHGDYSLNAKIFRISENGEYAITSFNGAVYLANSNMPYKGNLQNGNLKYSDFAFSSDGKTIYAATSNRKSIQIGHYPSLIRDNEIQLNGYPQLIQRDGNKLIVSLVSKEDDSINSGIEVVEIP